MDAQAILDFLVKLGLTPLELLSIAAIIVLYRDNRELWNRVKQQEIALQRKANKPQTPLK